MQPVAPRLTASVFAIFLVNGMMLGAWGGSLAGLRDRAHTDAQGIGIILIVTGLSAIASMQVSGRISDRITPRLPSLVSGFSVIAGLSCAAFASNYVTLLISGLLIGIGNGAMDVSMNALGVVAEQLSGRAVMSRFHAFFSLGGLLGSGIVMLAAQIAPQSANPRSALLISAGISVFALAALLKLTPHVSSALAAHAEARTPEENETSVERQGPRSGLLGVPLQAWLLGIMALFFGFSEGTALDWASIQVTDVAHVSPGTGAIGLVAVSATMVLIRLGGDHVVDRLGRVAAVRFGAPVTVLGYVVTLVSEQLWVLVLGWLLVGLGTGLIAPQIYGIAGHLGGGRVLAIVTGFGYTAFLAGPAIIGFVSAHVGIQRAMLVPLLAGILLTAMTFSSALREP